MNNKEFISALANKVERTQDETQKLVNTALQAMGDNFESGDSVLVSGFGAFEVKKRLERIINNPATGLIILVPPILVLNFHVADSIKEKQIKGRAV